MSKLLKKINLLYVEDDESIRIVLQRVLERKVKNLYTAVDGEDGFEKFLENKPDIILTDIKMPKLSGLEMSKKIKEISKNIPIIVISAHSEATYFLESIEIGIDAYLLKPINRSKLLDLLEVNAKVVLYEREKEKSHKLIQAVIDLQASIIFSAHEDKKTLFANKLFFDFFGSSSSTSATYDSTCSYDEINQNHQVQLLDPSLDLLWLDYLFENINKKFKIKILKDDKEHIFLVTTKEIEDLSLNENIIIITLIEI